MTALRKLLYELIKKSFDVSFLDAQLVNLKDIQKREYLKYLLDQIERKGFGHWEFVAHGFLDIGKVYGFDEDFPEDYINNSDYFDETRNDDKLRERLPVVFQKINMLHENTASFSNEVFNQTKNGKLQAPVIALFCRIVEHSNTIIRGYDESKEKFCMKVCKKFSLPYTDNVRKHFKDAEPELKETDKNFIKIEEYILPNLPIEEKRKIDQYIKGKIKTFA